MHPDSPTPSKPLHVPPRQVTPVHDRAGRASQPAQTAAANIARSQIDHIYSNDPNAHMPAPQPAQPAEPVTTSQPVVEPEHPTPTISRSFTPEKQAEPINAYQRTHDESALHADQDTWKKYHSAWQSYYQQYFHRYYAGHIQATQVKLAEQQAHIESLKDRPAAPVDQTSTEALTDLRSQIRHKVHETTTKARKSRHFVPIVAAIVVMFLFAFLQYNSVLIANAKAYVIPSSADPADLITPPSSTVAPDDNPRLLIPKIAVDVPVIWNATPDHDSQMTAMKKGVAWFNIKGANAKPGQVGNTVLSGHSSNDVFDDGEYKFVFARLEQLKKDDTIYINNDGVRYTYTVTRIRVVKPTEVSALTEHTDKPIITLITCTPLGTATNRLLVTAEQISPNPHDAAKPTTDSGDESDDAAMPGNSPTFFERLFGAN